MNGLVAFVVWRSDVRHFVVLINILAIVALAGFLAWSVFSRRGPEKTAGEPGRSSSPTTTSKAAGSSACSAGA